VNAPPYFNTIRYGDIDGQAGAEVVGWGGNGIARSPTSMLVQMS